MFFYECISLCPFSAQVILTNHRTYVDIKAESEDDLTGLLITPAYVPTIQYEEHPHHRLRFYKRFNYAVKYELILLNNDLSYFDLYLRRGPFKRPLQLHNQIITSSNFIDIDFENSDRYSSERFYIRHTGKHKIV